MAKLGVGELQNKRTDSDKIWRDYFRWRYDPASKNSSWSPQ